MWTVYVIQNDYSKEIYIGITGNLKERLLTHNAKGKKFTTRKQGNWVLIYAEAYKSKNDALLREKRLKAHGSGKIELFKRINVVCLIPKLGRDAAKVSLATVYQKHSSLRTRKRMYRG